MKNCFEGYLTEACVKCPNWKNNADCIGCAASFPIMYCPHFAKMYNEREGNKNVNISTI